MQERDVGISASPRHWERSRLHLIISPINQSMARVMPPALPSAAAVSSHKIACIFPDASAKLQDGGKIREKGGKGMGKEPRAFMNQVHKVT